MVGLAACAALVGCVPLAGTQRAAISSLSCAQTAVRESVPASIPDERAHCLAAASIAWRCSVTEAYGAGIAKELKDLFGPGDAEWRDLRADAHGVRCARAAASQEDIERCCAARSSAGPEP